MHKLCIQQLNRALSLHTNKDLHTCCLKGGSPLQQVIIMLRVSNTPKPMTLRIINIPKPIRLRISNTSKPVRLRISNIFRPTIHPGQQYIQANHASRLTMHLARWHYQGTKVLTPRQIFLNATTCKDAIIVMYLVTTGVLDRLKQPALWEA